MNMKHLYFSIMLGLAPAFCLHSARGEQPAPAEHKHEDGSACTADHGHDDHQHKAGETCTQATPTKNTGMRTEPSAQATMNWKVTSTRKGKHARATMNAKSLRKKIPANRGT